MILSKKSFVRMLSKFKRCSLISDISFFFRNWNGENFFYSRKNSNIYKTAIVPFIYPIYLYVCLAAWSSTHLFVHPNIHHAKHSLPWQISVKAGHLTFYLLSSIQHAENKIQKTCSRCWQNPLTVTSRKLYLKHILLSLKEINLCF